MPTILLFGKYRFFFNSREELRMHVNVSTSEGTAKFWLEPIVSLSSSYNLNSKDLKEIQKITEDKEDEFINQWKQHFNR